MMHYIIMLMWIYAVNCVLCYFVTAVTLILQWFIATPSLRHNQFSTCDYYRNSFWAVLGWCKYPGLGLFVLVFTSANTIWTLLKIRKREHS